MAPEFRENLWIANDSVLKAKGSDTIEVGMVDVFSCQVISVDDLGQLVQGQFVLVGHFPAKLVCQLCAAQKCWLPFGWQA